MAACICVTPPGQTNNDTDLKFGTHTPIDLIQKLIFRFFEKMTLRAASLEKLVDFPHNSSIAWFALPLLFLSFIRSLRVIFSVYFSSFQSNFTS